MTYNTTKVEANTYENSSCHIAKATTKRNESASPMRRTIIEISSYQLDVLRYDICGGGGAWSGMDMMRHFLLEVRTARLNWLFIDSTDLFLGPLCEVYTSRIGY